MALGAVRLVTMDQVEGIAIRLRSLMRQRHQGRLQLADHGTDHLIARRLLAAQFLRRVGHLAVDGRRRHPGLTERRPLDELPEGSRQLPLILVVPLLAGQSGQTFPAVAIDPAAGGAEDEPLFLGDLRQGDAIFQKGTDDLEPRERNRASPGRLLKEAGADSGSAGPCDMNGQDTIRDSPSSITRVTTSGAKRSARYRLSRTFDDARS